MAIRFFSTSKRNKHISSGHGALYLEPELAIRMGQRGREIAEQKNMMYIKLIILC